MTADTSEIASRIMEAQFLTIELLIGDVSQALGNSNLEHSAAMRGLEVGRLSSDQKCSVRQRLIAWFSERRQPCAVLLTELQRQGPRPSPTA
jgi:hypothetical protein